MAGPPPPLDPLPPIGASPADMAAHANAVAANQIFGEGYVQAQLAGSGADPGSMFAHQVAQNAAIAAQGVIQQQILPRHAPTPSASSHSRVAPQKPRNTPVPSARTTARPIPRSPAPVRMPAAYTHRTVPRRKLSIGLGEWVAALVVIFVWYYIATIGFSFLADPLAYIPPVLFAYIVIEDWAGG